MLTAKAQVISPTSSISHLVGDAWAAYAKALHPQCDNGSTFLTCGTKQLSAPWTQPSEAP